MALILFVNDVSREREQLVTLLERSGHILAFAADGDEAMRMWRAGWRVAAPRVARACAAVRTSRRDRLSAGDERRARNRARAESRS